MSEDSPRVLLDFSAAASAEAALRNPSLEPTEGENRYREIVSSCVPKPGGHAQLAAPPEVIEQGGKRLYTVTTLASSPRYGGKRTVSVCDEFERATQIIETNEGDIFETTYHLAVIDTVVAGWLYYYVDEQYWYRWDHEVGRYLPIEKPAAFEGLVGLGGIG